MAVFQIWTDNMGTTCAEFHECLHLFARGMLAPTAKLEFTFSAKNALEVGQAKSRLLGFEEYRPLFDERGDIDSLELEEYPY